MVIVIGVELTIDPAMAKSRVNRICFGKTLLVRGLLRQF
jgi:hypothetical protein